MNIVNKRYAYDKQTSRKPIGVVVQHGVRSIMHASESKQITITRTLRQSQLF